MSAPANNSLRQDWSKVDTEMMSLALQLARKGQYTARPNPMVGCVIARNDQLISSGWHQKCGQPHAEVNALESAAEQARGATCYVTLEPCAHFGKTPPCAEALIKAGVTRVVAAMQDPNPEVAGRGFQLLRDAGIRVETGLLASQARELNRGFVSRFERQRPWLTCKLAMSLDGRTALSDGSSKWITSPAAREDVQKLRARQDAIITGIGTQRADNPSLNVRAQDGGADPAGWFTRAQSLGFIQPARVLLDRAGRADPRAKLFAADADVFWTSQKFTRETQKKNICQLPEFSSLKRLLECFAAKGMNNLLLESGHRLAGAFFQQGLIDELVVYMAPKLMGKSGIGLFDLEVTRMSEAPSLKLKSLRQVGEDIRLAYSFESIHAEKSRIE